MRAPRSLAAAAGALVILVAGGCSTSGSVSIGGKTLDNEKLEKELTKKFSTDADPGTKLAITCPDDQKTAAGTKFTCTMTVDGDKRSVFVTLQKDQRYTAVPELESGKLAAELTRELSKQAGADPAQVSTVCPQHIEPYKGRKFTCTLTAPDGTKVEVDITLTNNRGGYHAIVPKGQFS